MQRFESTLVFIDEPHFIRIQQVNAG